MSNAEQGIGQTQIKADGSRLAQGEDLQDRHDSSITYLNDRIFLYLGAIAFLGLLVVWATASSALILYGSFGIAILLVVLWGLLRIQRIKRITEDRARQVAAMQSDDKPN